MKINLIFIVTAFFVSGCIPTQPVIQQERVDYDANKMMLKVWEQQQLEKMMRPQKEKSPVDCNNLTCDHIVNEFNKRCKLTYHQNASVQTKDRVKATKLDEIENGEESIWSIEVE